MIAPSFSFLLPAYRIRFFKDALHSILNQSYSNFQVLVSDDASPEPLKEVVSLFSDERVSYRRNQINMGASNLVEHWNSLLNICDSDYVVIASDDDIYRPDFLMSIVKAINNYPNVDLFRSCADIIDERGYCKRIERMSSCVLDKVGYVNHLMNPQSILCIGNCVFKTVTLKSYGGFVSFPYGWKSDSATQIMLSNKGVVCIGDVLFSFRMSGNNISSLNRYDDERNRMKLCALLKFNTWMREHLSERHLLSIESPLKNRLQGESRSYYGSLSLSSFRRLYKKFCRERWFYSYRNRISFILGWVWLRIKRYCAWSV